MRDCIAEIAENRLICREGGIYSLTLRAPSISDGAAPGRFYEIRVGGEGGRFTLRRPFSVAFYDRDSITIRYNVVGEGTKWLSGMKAGDRLDVLGPLGNGWPVDKTKKTLLAGGSTGIFSVLGAAMELGAAAEPGSPVKAVLGFKTASLINSLDDFRTFGADVSVITDDGSSGRGGLITELLSEELAKGIYDRVFICGSTMMMKKCAETAAGFGAEAFVSLEERMGCGVGACMGCVAKIKADNENGWEYKRVCREGPVFLASEVVW